MIGTIRKHSAWLWWLIAGLTIISFVAFMGKAPTAGRGGAGGSFGTVYGHEVTAEEVGQAKRDFNLFYLMNSGEWPAKNANITEVQIDQQTYLNILFSLKAKALGVVIPDEAVADAASQILHSQGLAHAVGGGSPVPLDRFLEFLKASGYTAADFQHSVRSQLIVEQLRLTLGLSGSLVTPQEAAALYDYEHREAHVQGVFFAVSNYLSQVTVNPGAVGEFFTNNMGYYRLPDRLQVNYVWFNVTNYLETAKTELSKTNALEQMVDANYKQFANSPELKDAKTPEEAKAKIRQVLIQRRAFNDAALKANEFKKALYAMDPVKPENIPTLAKQFGLTSRLSEPFAENGQVEEFANAPSVVQTAFALNAESPFSDLLQGEDGIYMIGVANQLPSTAPSFTEIRPRVERDFRMQSALALANRAGTNFFVTASVQIAAGKSFAQAAVADALTPVVFTPFSSSTAEIPEVGEHAQPREIKMAAFGTAPGHVSRFVPTQDGGFVLYVQKIESVDTTKNTPEIASFTSQIRRGRENEAFNMWVNGEASRELRNIPVFAPKAPGAPSQP